MNGTFTSTILIREKDDTFIKFDIENIIIIKENDVDKFFNIYEENRENKNILIDMRMELIIMLAILKYENDILIYDPNKLKVSTIYNYFNEYLFINSSELSLANIKKILYVKIILDYCFSSMQILWNIRQAIEFTKKSNNIAYVLINCIGAQAEKKCDINNIRKITQLINNIINKSNWSSLGDKSLKINTYELFCGLASMIE